MKKNKGVEAMVDQLSGTVDTGKGTKKKGKNNKKKKKKHGGDNFL